MLGRASLTDVARAAGVSVGAASKALRGKPGVSEATRKKVNEIAERLNYEPNPIAQTLVSGKSGSIGMFAADQGSFSSPIMAGVQNELSANGVTVLLSNAFGDVRLERQCIDALLARNVDGLLIVNHNTNIRPPLHEEVPVPVVYAYAASSDERDCSITVDNVEAGRMAVRHMAEIGRDRIAIVCGEASSKAAIDRLQGAMEMMDELGLTPVNIPRFGTWMAEWSRQEILRLIDAGTAFDAVICQSDVLAMGALDVLHTHGISVPQDVALMGHDDWGPIVLNTNPPLTSMSNALDEIGRLAARRLMDAMDGKPSHGVEYASCALMRRASTDC
ncbi:LacI family DNA-binding transcriptional regulator [Bifidobacterium aerophilum]|uniref:Substrate-binding domain-containing protein n=1 Tax=Bifidobacterium aerophilum TaxID=1798155 RepID=A0A6N9Z3G0_9BIFI|nr:LacI family DNA-binding transcriptional regulator [Bifidobacterium aerophilum]NEG89016.1 substrate-binding domain-containing protein [Bifidobacterium aerophilum]